MESGVLENRARGMLLGLAIGDALGAPIEFLPSPSHLFIAKMGDKIAQYHPNRRAAAGIWTDDTSMALCIADSLLERHGYDSYDIMSKFHDFAYYKYRTHPDAPLDVGAQTLKALDDYEKNPVIERDTPRTNSAGNGCIMRLAPIIIANVFVDEQQRSVSSEQESVRITGENIQLALKMARLSCRETHNSLMAEAVTEMFAIVLYTAMAGLSKNNILSQILRWTSSDLWGSVIEVYTKMDSALIDKKGEVFYDLGGYSVDAFLIAIWGFTHFDNFKDGMLAVIRLGGDTDTNAAIYGQLAGAYYGYDNIPKEWIDGLYLGNEIRKIADDLLAMPECPIICSRFEDDINFKIRSKNE